MVEDHVRHTERSYCEAVFTRVRDSARGDITHFNYSAQTLDTHAGDGILIFRYGEKVVVSLVEAKMIYENREFDSIHQNRSRFSRQIRHQRDWADQCACFEMFLLNFPLGKYVPPFDAKGSSCIMQADIQQLITNEKDLWTFDKLAAINRNRMQNLRQIISHFLLHTDCPEHEVGSDVAFLPLRNKKGKNINVPLPEVGHPSQVRDRIQNFLEQQQIEFYEYLDFTRADGTPVTTPLDIY